MVFAIDEFQQIARYPEKNVEALLRIHVQGITNTTFIFAGSQRHLLNEMFFSPARPFFNSTSVIHLLPIHIDIYTNFVEGIMKEFDKKIEKKEVGKIYNIFEGYTFYMHRTLNQAFSLTPLKGWCNIDILKKALEMVISMNSTLYREILSNIPERQKEVLYAIAKAGKVENPMSGSFIRDNGLVSASSVQSALKKLLDSDLITKIEKTYTLTDKFLSLWIKQTYGSSNIPEL